MFKSIDMYFRGVWDKKRTIEELKYYKINEKVADFAKNYTFKGNPDSVLK